MMKSARGTVLHVISGIDVGGAENHLLDLAGGLIDRGFDVTVAYLKGDGEFEQEFRDVGCTVVNIGIRHDIDPLGLARLVRYIASNEHDIVHGHLFHGNVYGTVAATLGGVPYVVASKHNDPPFWRQQPYRTIHELTIQRADRVCPISDHVHRYILTQTGVNPDDVQTIRYGLDPAPFDRVDDSDVAAVRSELGVADDSQLIGTVARLTQQKDLETLLRAFALVREHRSNVQLAVVGRGERRPQLEELSEQLSVDDSVTFAGFRSDVPVLMRAFDVFALTSRWEGFGVVLMEAMAAKTPVVASNVSAIPEVVADGETGFMAPSGDIEAFADRFNRLLDDGSLALALGEAGRRRLEREFSVERMVGEMEALYRDLLAGEY